MADVEWIAVDESGEILEHVVDYRIPLVNRDETIAMPLAVIYENQDGLTTTSINRTSTSSIHEGENRIVTTCRLTTGETREEVIAPKIYYTALDEPVGTRRVLTPGKAGKIVFQEIGGRFVEIGRESATDEIVGIGVLEVEGETLPKATQYVAIDEPVGTTRTLVEGADGSRDKVIRHSLDATTGTLGDFSTVSYRNVVTPTDKQIGVGNVEVVKEVLDFETEYVYKSSGIAERPGKAGQSLPILTLSTLILVLLVLLQQLTEKYQLKMQSSGSLNQ